MAVQPSPASARPRPRGRVRMGLFFLLIAAVGVTLFGAPPIEQAVREGRAPRVALVVAPALLAAYIALFAAYRFAQVRAGRYLAGKAFVQVVLMVLVLAVALPGSLDRWRSAAVVAPSDLEHPLRSADPEVRALAAEVARYRPRADGLRHVPRLLELLEDGSPEVRRQARASLVVLAGTDAGGEGPDAAARWGVWWRQHGAGVR